MNNFLKLMYVFLFFVAHKTYAVELYNNGNQKLNFMMYVQPWITLFEGDAPNSNHTAAQFYIRRARLLLSGNISEKVNFFYGTISSNFGKDGAFEDSIGTGDLWVEYAYSDHIKIDSGFLMIPFARNFRQSGAAFHTIDSHSLLMKYPVSSHKYGRDFGIGIRGKLFEGKINYYQHITRGRWVSDATPRLSGRLVYNFFDSDDSFFLKGTFFGKKKILSMGVGYDFQAGTGLTVSGNVDNYFAWTIDLFLDVPVENNSVTVLLAMLNYQNSVKQNNSLVLSGLSGTGIMFESGYRISKVEPLIGVDWYRPVTANTFEKQMINPFVAFNYWIDEHKSNLKLQLSQYKAEGVRFNNSATRFILQYQIFIN